MQAEIDQMHNCVGRQAIIILSPPFNLGKQFGRYQFGNGSAALLLAKLLVHVALDGLAYCGADRHSVCAVGKIIGSSLVTVLSFREHCIDDRLVLRQKVVVRQEISDPE
jgi:hypothetical protein